MTRFSTTALFTASLLLPAVLSADELQIEILKADDFNTLKAVSKDLGIVVSDNTGLSIIEEDEEAATRENAAHDNLPSFVSAEAYQGDTFQVGDYIVLCFTPPVNLYMRIFDQAPNGTSSQIYPIDGNTSRQVKGGSRHCIGNQQSDTLLEMASSSGTGQGTVWLIGTASEQQANQMDLKDFALPTVGVNSKAPAGSKIVSKNKIEGWIDYVVE